jgi:hypothetical protein
MQQENTLPLEITPPSTTTPAPANPPPTSQADTWRLRKGTDGTIYGPVTKEEIKRWAQNSQIAPEDFIDQNNDQWQSCYEIPFLEMEWEVQIDPPHFYGPTTIGAIEEFYRNGLVKDDTIVNNLRTQSIKTVSEIFSKSLPLPESYTESLSQSQKSHTPTSRNTAPIDDPIPTRSISFDDSLPIANAAHHPKDQQIRQLEQELRFLKKDYEELLVKYRKLNQQFIEERNKNTRSAESY